MLTIQIASKLVRANGCTKALELIDANIAKAKAEQNDAAYTLWNKVLDLVTGTKQEEADTLAAKAARKANKGGASIETRWNKHIEKLRLTALAKMAGLLYGTQGTSKFLAEPNAANGFTVVVVGTKAKMVEYLKSVGPIGTMAAPVSETPAPAPVQTATMAKAIAPKGTVKPAAKK